jgi:hypothetical protein
MPVGCLPECPRAKMLYTVSCPRCVELRASQRQSVRLVPTDPLLRQVFFRPL